MRRLTPWLCQIGTVSLLFVAGCQTADGHRWTWPWEKAVAKEEYTIPPLADGRYSDPQTLPKSVMQTGLKAKATPDKTGLTGLGAGPGMAGGSPGSGQSRPGFGGY